MSFLKHNTAKAPSLQKSRISSHRDSRNIAYCKVIISANSFASRRGFGFLQILLLKFEMPNEAGEINFNAIPLIDLRFARLDTHRVLRRFDATAGSICIHLGEFSAKQQDL
jgi:hypothetical protein